MADDCQSGMRCLNPGHRMNRSTSSRRTCRLPRAIAKVRCYTQNPGASAVLLLPSSRPATRPDRNREAVGLWPAPAGGHLATHASRIPRSRVQPQEACTYRRNCAAQSTTNDGVPNTTGSSRKGRCHPLGPPERPDRLTSPGPATGWCNRTHAPCQRIFDCGRRGAHSGVMGHAPRDGADRQRPPTFSRRTECDFTGRMRSRGSVDGSCAVFVPGPRCS